MIPEVRRAVLSIDLDEREMLPLLSAGGFASTAALGLVVQRVFAAMRRDRSTLRGWLAPSQERPA